MLTAVVSWICFPGWEFDSCTIISRAEQENTLIIAIILLYETRCQYNATELLFFHISCFLELQFGNENTEEDRP